VGAFTRTEGTPASDVPGYRRFMPALMPTRNGSAVLFDLRVRTEEAERVVAQVRRDHPELHATFFHVVLWALARTLDRHPHLNRFLAGGRVHDRSGIWISYTVKTELSEQGTLLEVKRRFDPQASLLDTVRFVQAATSEARAGARSLADRELDLLLRLPPVVRRGVVRAVGAAHGLGLLPAGFVAGDPFFASAFVTNLGSVGLDSGFHHLYEYGTIPIFCTVGRIEEAVVVEDHRPAVGRVSSIKLTYDERVEDGLYAAHALEDLRAMLEHPERA
jgi:pyruvate/2-oxoglutarate dehydrogenase complex dihydrolipoamide acyltransferase (E2) component